ncbi:hypothetical protein MGH68_08610 [Erysipelothrix sp. D19-032]
MFEIKSISYSDSILFSTVPVVVPVLDPDLCKWCNFDAINSLTLRNIPFKDGFKGANRT